MVDGISVFPRRDFHGATIGSDSKMVQLNAAHASAGVGIDMDRNKEIGFLSIREPGTVIQFNKGIACAGHRYFHAHSVLKELSQAQRDIQNHFFFRQPAWPDGPGVLSPVARIQNNRVDIEVWGALYFRSLSNHGW